MTENDNQKLIPYSTDKLLVNFTKSRFGFYLLVAVAVHLVFVALTSLGYINDHWIDPDGAERRKAEMEAAQSNQMAAALPAPPESGSKTAVTASNPPAASASPAPSSALPNATNSAIMKQITEAAKLSEIPKAPDDLGISIQDTNPQ